MRKSDEWEEKHPRSIETDAQMDKVTRADRDTESHTEKLLGRRQKQTETWRDRQTRKDKKTCAYKIQVRTLTEQNQLQT